MRRVATVWIVLLLAGCASGKTDYYTLNAIPPQHPWPGGDALKPPVEVADVELPATIDRSAVVLDAGNDRLDVSQNSAWGAPLGQTIRHAVSSNLVARLPPGSVLPPGTPAPPGGVRVVTLNIEQFMGDTSGRVVLIVAWSIARSGAPHPGPLHHDRIEENARAGTPSAVVPAMSRALAELADRIAIKLI